MGRGEGKEKEDNDEEEEGGAAVTAAGGGGGGGDKALFSVSKLEGSKSGRTIFKSLSTSCNSYKCKENSVDKTAQSHPSDKGMVTLPVSTL